MRNGFHLIEVLSTVAIISILAALSFPLFINYLVQARRLEAAATLSRLSVAMEQFHIEHDSYEGATLAALHFPSNIKSHYQLRMETTANDYKLIAEPLGRQAEKDEKCGGLVLLANNEKSVTGRESAEACWRG